MSELIVELGVEVKEFLDSQRDDVQRSISRLAIIHTEHADVEIEQTKYLSPEETQVMKRDGPSAFTASDWFNDVEWMQQFDERKSDYRKLHLDVTYPLEYFEEVPTVGSFRGSKWHEQYGSVSGFGSSDKITVWTPEFIAPHSRVVTRLRYPDDPTALEQYNERYRQYLQTLNESQPTISYYRGWDRAFSHDADKTGLVLGGISLAGVGLKEVVKHGSTAPTNETKMVGLNLDYESEQNGYVGTALTLVNDAEATVEPFWDGENDQEPASEELLSYALQLVRNATAAA